MPIHPNSLANLTCTSGRPAAYAEPKKKVEILLTVSSKAIIRDRENNPIIAAGYASLSEFVEYALRRLVEIPPKPGSQ